MDGLRNSQMGGQATASMEVSSSIAEFVHRFQSLSLHQDSQENLIKDLIVHCQSIESKLRDTQRNLEDAARSRRELQQQLQQLLQVCPETVQLDNSYFKNSNPYVIVLIDGDGLLFKESFIAQGFEGGEKAAYALRDAILEQCGTHAGDIKVIAKVYADLAGLCKAMRRDSSLTNEGNLKDFSFGFTKAEASFDFVDVGLGKERAANKIRETAKWHLLNNNCKQVILGVSHGAGYAPFLDELFQDASVPIRVTILEGIPTVRELVATGANILNLNDRLFRSEKLVDRVSIPPEPYLPVLPVEAKTSTASVTSADVPTPATPTPATSAVSTPAQAPATTYARAAVKSATPPPKITFPLQLKAATTTARAQQPAKPTPWNPGPRGLDPPLQVSQSALDAIKKRKDRDKLCNNHYLRGPCAKGSACLFEHKYKPTKEELVAIAFLTRQNPCSSGQECEVEDCIYGHHCPSVRDGVCTHPYCKFAKEDHPPGTKIKGQRS